MDYKKSKWKEKKEYAHFLLITGLVSAHFFTLVTGGYGGLFHNVIGTLSFFEGSMVLCEMAGFEIFGILQKIRFKKPAKPVIYLEAPNIRGFLSAPTSDVGLLNAGE